MLERFLWIVADESYYEDTETKQHLPSLDWFQLNKYEPASPILLPVSGHSFTNTRKVLVEACSFHNKMYAHLKQHSKQKTKERNSKQVLVEQKKWVEIDELVTVTEKEYQEVIKLEERSRMRSGVSNWHSNSLQLNS
jgi:hypothetical protein